MYNFVLRRFDFIYLCSFFKTSITEFLSIIFPNEFCCCCNLVVTQWALETIFVVILVSYSDLPFTRFEINTTFIACLNLVRTAYSTTLMADRLVVNERKCLFLLTKIKWKTLFCVNKSLLLIMLHYVVFMVFYVDVFKDLSRSIYFFNVEGKIFQKEKQNLLSKVQLFYMKCNYIKTTLYER